MTFPIGFAHRGAKAHSSDNTIESFMLALDMGATALESDVWITADGHVVMDHDGVVGSWPKSTKLGEMNKSDLPAHIPSLAEFYQECGTNFQLSLDVKDPNAAAAVVDVSRKHDASMLERLWLCHPRWQIVAQWRGYSDQVILVDSTRISRIEEGLVERLALLTQAGINALNMHHKDWTTSDVELVRSHGLRAMAWDLQRPSDLKRLLGMNVDAVFSDHVDRMQHAISERIAHLGSQQN